jgi:multiple sugar transport system substrate-binding protein/raffinose/stachyose/melibiose transport system substrate-binding protein
MTLMGTWITGYWDGNGLVAGTDYDFFPFPEVTPGVALASVGPVDGWVMPAEAKNQEGAKKVLECLASPEAQKVMALLQGAIAANSNTDLSEQNSVMQKAAQQVANSEAFVFNYDLATPPAVAEVGLNMFVEFLDNPADIAGILGKTATEAAAAF